MSHTHTWRTLVYRNTSSDEAISRPCARWRRSPTPKPRTLGMTPPFSEPSCLMAAGKMPSPSLRYSFVAGGGGEGGGGDGGGGDGCGGWCRMWCCGGCCGCFDRKSSVTPWSCLRWKISFRVSGEHMFLWSKHGKTAGIIGETFGVTRKGGGGDYHYCCVLLFADSVRQSCHHLQDQSKQETRNDPNPSPPHHSSPLHHPPPPRLPRCVTASTPWYYRPQSGVL